MLRVFRSFTVNGGGDRFVENAAGLADVFVRRLTVAITRLYRSRPKYRSPLAANKRRRGIVPHVLLSRPDPRGSYRTGVTTILRVHTNVYYVFFFVFYLVSKHVLIISFKFRRVNRMRHLKKTNLFLLIYNHVHARVPTDRFTRYYLIPMI